jgi:hypothetical protein
MFGQELPLRQRGKSGPLDGDTVGKRVEASIPGGVSDAAGFIAAPQRAFGL